MAKKKLSDVELAMKKLAKVADYSFARKSSVSTAATSTCQAIASELT